MNTETNLGSLFAAWGQDARSSGTGIRRQRKFNPEPALQWRPKVTFSLAALCTALSLTIGCAALETSKPADPLPSWNDGAQKQAIVAFVTKVSTPGSSDYVPPDERIAVFDNDGTLWSEQPFYFQLFFALERVKNMAPEHPEWRTEQPFRAAIESDMDTLLAGGSKALLDLVLVTHAGMTTTEFERIVSDWIATARHPKLQRPLTDLVFQPMLELLAYLRANQFKTYIVSGGGIEFMRPFAESLYGVPPEQVIGSSIKTKYELRDGSPAILRLPEIDFIDDGPGKPVGIHQYIGRRPIFAAGNSDGDWQMLEWTTIGRRSSIGLIIHHTDAEREWAYDRDSKIGHLDKALDDAARQGWVVVDMKKDWKRVYRFQD